MKASELQNLPAGHKWINGYEGLYSASPEGYVFSVYSQKFLKGYPNHRGYMMITLYKDGNNKRFSVHRLIAKAFIPNPENKQEVDHIDTNRVNNNINNLRWVSRVENCNNPLTLQHVGDVHRGERNHNYHKHIPKEVRQKMSQSLKGHKVSIETRKKIGDANRGKIRDDNFKKYLSIVKKGRNMGKNNANAVQILQMDKTKQIIRQWDSISDAARELKISVTAITNCLKNRTKSSGGFIWLYC